MKTDKTPKLEYLAPQMSTVLLKSNKVICASQVVQPQSTLDSWDVEEIN